MINAGNSTAVVKEQIEDAVALAGYSAPTSWTDATDKINGTADQFERDQIADGMNGGLARDRINALFGGPVWAPEGAQLTIDFAANKAWTRNSAVTDSVDAVSLVRSGSALMLGPDGYEEFATGELARIDGIGAQVAPARTNKCANFNANPVDLTGVSIASGVGILSVVDDAAALAAAGLSGICTSGKVYRLDNSATAQGTAVLVAGTTGSTASHSLSCHMRGSGTAILRLTGGVGVATGSVNLGSSFQRSTNANLTPANSTGQLVIEAAPGAVVYFILNQLEEGSYASPPIITSGAAVSRPGDILSASVPDGGRAFVFEFDLLEPVVRTDTLFRRVLEFNNGIDNENSYTVVMSPTSKQFQLSARVGGVVVGSQSYTVALNEPGKVILAGVVDSLYRRLSLNGADSPAITTLAEVSGISRVGIGGTGRNSTENTFCYPGRFTERPITDFATPADAFAWAKSIAQGWA